MKELTQLTALQLDVLQVLWERGEASVNGVTEGLREGRGLAPSTVATLLARLERRGAVRRRRVRRGFVYSARIGREEARRAMVDGLARSLFDGDVGGLVQHLVSRGEFSAADLERVRALLDAKERGTEDGTRGGEA